MVAVGEGRIEANALVLVDLVPCNEASGVERLRALIRSGAASFESLDELVAAIDAYRLRAMKTAKTAGMAKNVHPGPDGRHHWHWDARILVQPRESNERRMVCAPRLTLSTLLVRGGHSDVVRAQGAQDFLVLRLHSEYVNVAGVGRMVAGECNDAVRPAMLDFPQRRLPAAH